MDIEGRLDIAASLSRHAKTAFTSLKRAAL
jgi:hypothetical protein